MVTIFCKIVSSSKFMPITDSGIQRHNKYCVNFKKVVHGMPYVCYKCSPIISRKVQCANDCNNNAYVYSLPWQRRVAGSTFSTFGIYLML